MSSSISPPASSSITRDIEGLLASVRNRIENTKVATEPQSEDEVEAAAGMSATLREGSAEVIDMRKSWIEGPKGKKVSKRSPENFGRG